MNHKSLVIGCTNKTTPDINAVDQLGNYPLYASSSSASAGHALQIALVDRASDNQPKPGPKFLGTFKSLMKAVKPRKNKDGPAFIPAVFAGDRRCGDNVTEITAIVLDLDGKDKHYTKAQIETAMIGYGFLAYSTHSYTPQKPRWRVIIFLADPIPTHSLKKALKAIGETFGLHTDPRCRDASHLYYLPSRSDTVIIEGKGKLLDPSRLLHCKESSRHTTQPKSRPERAESSEPRENISSLGSLPILRQGLVKESARDLPPQKQKRGNYNVARNVSLPEQLAMARALGLPVKGLTEKGNTITFRSPLPGHIDENPSCALYLQHGRIIMQDFSGHFSCDGKPVKRYCLAQLYHTIMVKRYRKLEGPTLAIWDMRLRYKAKLVTPREVKIPSCPDDVTASTRKVYEGFVLLLGLKYLYEKRLNETAFSQDFAAEWCEVSPSTANRAKIELMKRGVISLVDEHKGCFNKTCGLFLPGKVRKTKQRKDDCRKLRLFKNAVRKLSIDRAIWGKFSLSEICTLSGLSPEDVRSLGRDWLYENDLPENPDTG